MIINFPCKDCICLAICRHKPYTNLLTDCSLLCNFINMHTEEIEGNLYITIDIINKNTLYFRRLLQTHLKPTTWSVNDKGIFITHMKERTL